MRDGTVPEWKIKAVSDLANLIKEYPVVCAINLQGLPAKQLVKIKQSFGEDATVKMAKKSILIRALANVKMDELTDYFKDQPALLLSKVGPFKLSRKIQDSKVSAAAKAGDIAPKDIIIPAGETSFAPGPIVSELNKAGIAASIEGGKVVIKKESVIAKKGAKITKLQANTMTKMQIEPMEIGLDLVAAYEDGRIYNSDVLAINTEQVLGNMQLAKISAFNLAFYITYPTKDNIEMFIAKAFREAKSLATEANFMCPATAKDLLAKANAQANNLKAKLPDVPAAPAEEKKEETAEEPKTEEVKEEAKPEEEKPAEEKK
ncbi:MAG: 50S ribosomal protein L10 [archaeon]